MADFLADVWTDLKAAIDTAWPDITAIFVVTQIEKRDWYNLIQDKQMGAPWAVVDFPEWVPDDSWGIKNQTYQCNVGVYYIANDSGSHIKAALETKAAALQDQLLTVAPALGSYFLPTGDISIDAGANNAVNQGFRDAAMPYTCVSVKFEMIAGFALS